MKADAYNLVVLMLILAVFAVAAAADSKEAKERQVKAAFVYNFIKFVDWPNEADANQPITIGIIGSEDFIRAFNPVKDKKVKNRSISIKYFAGYEKLDNKGRDWGEKMQALKTCHILIFCNCDSVNIQDYARILKALRGTPVLTIGETKGFLESGGMINFVVENEKVQFEINNTAAKASKLDIHSKLLRLAKRVTDEPASNGAKN
ncbi:MAG: YfiR family protein [Sedimentisphaerales bacterium]|jgi:hypothetical protein